MFRASFPTAPEEAEKAESNWVKSNFDVSGANGGGKLRLAGTWVPADLALTLAQAYNIQHVVPPLIAATASSADSYRKPKSGVTANQSASTVDNPALHSTQTASDVSPDSTKPTSTRVLRSPTPKAVTPARAQPPTKRRKESPQPTPVSPQVVVPSPARTHATPAKQLAPASSPAKSTPRRKPAKVAEEDIEPDVPGPNPEDDIAEQKALIAKLKAEAAASALSAIPPTPNRQIVPATPAKKRALEDQQTPKLQFDMEKIQEVEEQAASGILVERPVVENKRATQLPAGRKAAAWGTLAFAVGVAAT